MSQIDLASLAEGALQERFEQDLQKIAENIQDENTDAKAKRKLTITLIQHNWENKSIKRNIYFT